MNNKKTALLSVYNKDLLNEFAAELVALGWDLLASSGTTKYLRERDILVRDIAEIVGAPILGHRVVTLSREIHAALLATDKPEDQAELERLKIPRIDLVYVNLYPLVEEIAKADSNLESVIEKTDIGGPTLLRSAAKGRRIVICRTTELRIAYKLLSGKYDHADDVRDKNIAGLVSIAEKTVSDYCAASSRYHGRLAGEAFFNEARLL